MTQIDVHFGNNLSNLYNLLTYYFTREGNQERLLSIMINRFELNTEYLGLLTIFQKTATLVRQEDRMSTLLATFPDLFKQFDQKKVNAIAFDTLQGFITNLSALLLQITRHVPQSLNHPFIAVDLELVKLLLTSSNLKKKVLGLTYLSTNIICMQRLESRQIKWMEESVLVKYLEMRKKALEDAFEEINIFDYIFGPNIHAAILQASPMILVFLYNINKLTFKDILQIWYSSETHDETLEHSILTLVSKVITSLKVEDSNVLF